VGIFDLSNGPRHGWLIFQNGKASLQTNPKRQRGGTLNSSRLTASPSLALFDVAHFSAADAAKANSRGRKPTERSGRGTQSRVAATAVTNCCRRNADMNPSPQISAGWHPQRSAAVASRLNCATSQLAIRVSFVGHSF